MTRPRRAASLSSACLSHTNDHFDSALPSWSHSLVTMMAIIFMGFGIGPGSQAKLLLTSFGYIPDGIGGFRIKMVEWPDFGSYACNLPFSYWLCPALGEVAPFEWGQVYTARANRFCNCLIQYFFLEMMRNVILVFQIIHKKMLYSLLLFSTITISQKKSWK